MHIQTVALCRNRLEGNCNFTAEICWWNHEETQNNHVVKIACYICNESFSMYHRKTYHPRVVQKCTNFPQKFHSSSCWFVHDNEEEMETEEDCEGRTEEIIKDMK